MAIFAGVRGYLDKIDVGAIGRVRAASCWRTSRLASPASSTPIRADREIKPETEKKLVAFLDGFAKSFSPESHLSSSGR